MTRAAGAASELLVQSLTETAEAMRRSETRCRGAYAAPGPLRAASLRLADAYARAAEVFEQELADVENRIAIEGFPTRVLPPEPCHPECTQAGIKLSFLHPEAPPDMAAMNRGRAAVGMPPLSIERLPAPPAELVLDPPEFPEGCKPTAKCASGRLVYCKNCQGSTSRAYDALAGNYEAFQCHDCRATTYVEIPV